MTQRIDSSQQLTLLPPDSVPSRFRLSDQTRRHGLQQVAALRAEIAARRAARDDNLTSLPRRQPRRPEAA